MSSDPLSSRHFFGSGSAYFLDFRIFSENPGFWQLDSVLRHAYVLAPRHNLVRRKIIKKIVFDSRILFSDFLMYRSWKVEKVNTYLFFGQENSWEVTERRLHDRKNFFIIFPHTKAHWCKKLKLWLVFLIMHQCVHFQKNTAENRKKCKKRTFMLKKIPVRGSDDQKYFYFIFLHQKLSKVQKTEMKIFFFVWS